MSKRMQRLKQYETRLPYAEWWSRLKPEGQAAVVHFIQRHDHLSVGEFEQKAHRLFLDVPNKPSNWSLINQVLVNVNYAAKE